MFVILSYGEWLDMIPEKRILLAKDHLKSLSNEDAAKVLCGCIVDLTNACINFLDGKSAGEDNVSAIESYIVKYYEQNYVKSIDELASTGL